MYEVPHEKGEGSSFRPMGAHPRSARQLRTGARSSSRRKSRLRLLARCVQWDGATLAAALSDVDAADAQKLMKAANRSRRNERYKRNAKAAAVEYTLAQLQSDMKISDPFMRRVAKELGLQSCVEKNGAYTAAARRELCISTMQDRGMVCVICPGQLV